MSRRNRGEGSLYQPKGCRNFILRYYINGQQKHESSGTSRRGEALAKLRQRIEEASRTNGDPSQAKKTTYEELRALLLDDYRRRGNKSLRLDKNKKESVCGLPALDDYFTGWKAIRITSKEIDKFSQAYKERTSGPTANRALALLRRMFSLAAQRKLVFEKPHIAFYPESEARQGFVTDEEFNKIVNHLPEPLQVSARFLYLTGCRLGAAKKITGAMLRNEKGKLSVELPGSITKNGERLPLPLPEKIAAHFRGKIVVADEPLFSFVNIRKAWTRACKEAGKPDVLIHDLRRSGVRNLVRAGNPDQVVMRISGHKTREVFSRYNIVSDEDVERAMQNLDKVSRVV